MITLQERRELWAWHYAHRSFTNCAAACDHIVKNGFTDTHPVYYPLTSAVFIAYARPFRKSYGLGSRPDEIVPPDKRAIHELLLQARDKVYAHVDAHDILHWDGTPSVDVRIEVMADGIGSQALEITPLPVGFEVISALANELAVKCVYHIKKIVGKNKASFPKELGIYHLSIRDGAEPFVLDDNPDAPVSWTPL